HGGAPVPPRIGRQGSPGSPKNWGVRGELPLTILFHGPAGGYGMPEDGSPKEQAGPADPLGVRAGARWGVERARSVRIDDRAVGAAAAELAQWRFQVPGWSDSYHFAAGTPRTANYVLALDALNFCFWGEPRWRFSYRGEMLDGYRALAAALKRAVEAGEPI